MLSNPLLEGWQTDILKSRHLVLQFIDPFNFILYWEHASIMQIDGEAKERKCNFILLLKFCSNCKVIKQYKIDKAQEVSKYNIPIFLVN